MTNDPMNDLGDVSYAVDLAERLAERARDNARGADQYDRARRDVDMARMAAAALRRLQAWAPKARDALRAQERAYDRQTESGFKP